MFEASIFLTDLNSISESRFENIQTVFPIIFIDVMIWQHLDHDLLIFENL